MSVPPPTQYLHITPHLNKLKSGYIYVNYVYISLYMYTYYSPPLITVWSYFLWSDVVGYSVHIQAES